MIRYDGYNRVWRRVVSQWPKTRLWLKYPYIQIENACEWPDLSPLLTQRKSLRGLTLTGPVGDISSINEFPSLEELIISHASSGTIDLACLPRLKVLGIERGVRVELRGGENLTTLSLSSPFREWNDFLPTLPRLETLDLVSPRKLPRALPKSLRRLEIALFAHWPDDWYFEGIEGLTILMLEDVRGLRDLTPFSAVKNLEVLHALDCDELVSLDGPALAPNFTEQLMGRTGLRKLRRQGKAD